MENIAETEDSSSPIPLFTRELSWIDFNERVMEEGLRKDMPLLERFRFLCIVSSNFDEFFMVRVAAVKRAIHSGKAGRPLAPGEPDPTEQMKRVSEKVHALMHRQYECLRSEIFPGLAKRGLELLRPDTYTLPQMDYLESFFMSQVYPILTPLRLEEDQIFPAIINRNVSAAFLLVPESAESGAGEEQTAIVRLPPSLNRIIRLPAEAGSSEQRSQWALLDDVILVWGGYIFPGYRVKESMLFKVNRDADFSVDEERDEDFIAAMTEVLEGREKSSAVQMVYSSGSVRLRDEFARRLSLGEEDLYEVDGPLNMGELMDLANTPGFDEMKEKPWEIHSASAFAPLALATSAAASAGADVSMWDLISQGDLMLHLPYQSFDPVVRFFQAAAADPQVVSIKTALYRTSGGSSAPSPIIRALEEAALNGKQVTALVELKARFDEERNISWANRLEKAGVIVVYGLSRLKVHAKVSIVMRREHDRIKRYVHLSTGNYNDKTAKLYEDFCLFTGREEIAYDAGLLFNLLTGYSDVQTMRRLVMAPVSLKRRLIELIDREAHRAGQKYPGKIMAKVNALTDTDIIEALYRASNAGVKIFLCVRGVCTLVPGLPEFSQNIRVISVIDHYLEHSRVFYFANGGAEELYLASADWMPRNLDRRVELMFPIQDEKMRTEICDMLNAYFKDNCQARVLGSNGAWTRLTPGGEKPFRVQKDMLSRAARESASPWQVKTEFTVRRSQPGDR